MIIGNNSRIPQSAPVRRSFIRGVQDGKCLINRLSLSQSRPRKITHLTLKGRWIVCQSSTRSVLTHNGGSLRLHARELLEVIQFQRSQVPFSFKWFPFKAWNNSVDHLQALITHLRPPQSNPSVQHSRLSHSCGW